MGVEQINVAILMNEIDLLPVDNKLGHLRLLGLFNLRANIPGHLKQNIQNDDQPSVHLACGVSSGLMNKIVLPGQLISPDPPF